MITIGIVLYNEEKHLSLLERNLVVLRDSQPAIQICIVDNASTDLTADGLRNLQQLYGFDLWHRSTNNMGEARQDVVEAARYEWVGFIDGDCEISQTWLRVVFESCCSIKSDVAAFGGPWHSAGRWKNHYDALFASPFGHFSLPQLSFKDGVALVAHIPTANVIYRKIDVQMVGGFSGAFFRVGEDLDLSHRLRASGKKLQMIAAMPIGHYLPDNASAWARKIFVYGRGRVQVAAQNGVYSDRILVLPLMFLLVMVMSGVVQFPWVAISYLAAVLTIAIIYGWKGSVFRVLQLLLATHFSYALGMAFEWLRKAIQYVSHLTTGAHTKQRRRAEAGKIDLLVDEP